MHFDPQENARRKAAARQRDAERLAAGEIDPLELSRRNSMIPVGMIRGARIVRDPQRRPKANWTCPGLVESV